MPYFWIFGKLTCWSKCPRKTIFLKSQQKNFCEAGKQDICWTRGFSDNYQQSKLIALFCWLFGKSVFLGHLDQYLSLPKIQKYGIVIIEKISYAISSRSCQKWQFSSSYDSWVWKSGFFMISVSSWSQAGSLGTPIMSEGAVVGSQSALSSFRELLDKKPSYLRQKCFWWLSLN